MTQYMLRPCGRRLTSRKMCCSTLSPIISVAVSAEMDIHAHFAETSGKADLLVSGGEWQNVFEHSAETYRDHLSGLT